MPNNPSLDQIRKATLDKAERSERNYRLAFFAAFLWEAIFLMTFLFAMERHNRSHALLLLATVGTYTTIVLSIVALGTYVNRGHLRLLKAIELLESRLDTPENR